ncbi:MAG: hypothetical protein HND48_18910 [Chloroflexi bacterium]|nr:hypothetical protein [Chloroflexota bacterium]
MNPPMNSTGRPEWMTYGDPMAAFGTATMYSMPCVSACRNASASGL